MNMRSLTFYLSCQPCKTALLRCRSALYTLAVAGLLALATGCSSGSGATSKQNIPPVRDETSDPGVVYNGPSPDTADVQNFKVSLWENLVGEAKCGNCHGTNGQIPAFARSDDINLAYTLANGLVNLEDPASSRLVTKVLSGHSCWVQSNQFCAGQIAIWISNWATESGVTLTETALRAPDIIEVSSSLTFPEDTAAFGQHVYPLLTHYCADCHRADAPQAPVQPYFASSNLAEAYAAAQTKMLFNVQGDTRDASRSRLVVRLREEAHNCWDNNCPVASNTMEAALEAFAATMEMRELDSTLLSSKAMRIGDGTAISQGGRVETNAIAIYNFKEGAGTQANDSSVGFPPGLTLNLIGDVEWVSNWGVRINSPSGRLQGAVESSNKLRRYITQTGEYSIEAWVVPASVTQEGPARIVTYSAGNDMSRNFTLGQALYNYNFLNRTSTTNGNGMPMLSTPDADMVLQATLQHVVASYDAINGRRIYVNGQLVADDDPVGPGNLNQWDQTFALVLGNEISGEYPWLGTIRFLAIHNRALTEEQARGNYEVGVGQKILVPFSVSHLVDGMDDAYIVFQVEQFDDYSYLFSKPFFFSFSETPPVDIEIRGLRIGVNGREAGVGQVFANLDTLIMPEDYDPEQGIPLSSMGAVIAAEKGPEQDQFFLSFDHIGARSRTRDPDPVPPLPEPQDLEPQPRAGVRTFAEIHASLSAMTGIPVTDPALTATYEAVKQQMPPAENIKGFLVAHQMGITQLAVKYCNVLASDAGRMQAMFPGFDGTTFDTAGRAALIDPLLKVLLAHNIAAAGTQLSDQPLEADSRARLQSLINTMTADCVDNVCSATVARNAVTSVCAAALGSAIMLVQ
jgi:hypothetical protein